MRDAWASSAHDQADRAEAVPGDVAAIVIRAGELGFSPARVAIALGVSPRALDAIELAAKQRRWGGRSDTADRGAG